MLGVEDYGSDSDSEPQTNSATASALANPPKRAPKKIAIGLPILPKEIVDGDDGLPAAKKQRLESGAGRSSLLSMLPTPKQKQVVAPGPQKVLGGGSKHGLVLNTSSPAPSPTSGNGVKVTESMEGGVISTTLFRPSSLAKGRANISLEERAGPQTSTAPATDFFSLGNSPSSSSPRKPVLAKTSALELPGHSAAPEINEFKPPEPTPTDLYPGYYLLPSGSWAAYDPVYYKTFYDKWQSEYNTHVRALEKGQIKGFEGLDDAEAEEVDAKAEMERAKKEIQEREEKKALTYGAGGAAAAPRMNIKGAKLGGRARSRHQLSTLLTEAYENREAMEERIAEGRRNRKEAGNKYGF